MTVTRSIQKEVVFQRNRTAAYLSILASTEWTLSTSWEKCDSSGGGVSPSQQSPRNKKGNRRSALNRATTAPSHQRRCRVEKLQVSPSSLVALKPLNCTFEQKAASYRHGTCHRSSSFFFSFYNTLPPMLVLIGAAASYALFSALWNFEFEYL